MVTRDENGMALELVGLESSARMAINFDTAIIPTEAELLAFPPLPSGYHDMGLFTEDGGYAPEWEMGDVTNLYQKGYSVSTGEKGKTFTVTFAETRSPYVRQLLGVSDKVASDPVSSPIGVIIATRYAGGYTDVLGGRAIVTEVSANRGTSGDIASYEVTFKWLFDSTLCGYHRTVTFRDENHC